MLDVSGRAVDFRDVVRFVPGGGVRLEAAGQLALDAGSLIDVSGSVRGGDAGRLEILSRNGADRGDVAREYGQRLRRRRLLARC